MKRKLILILACLIGMTSFAQNTHILPTPQSVEWQDGDFDWNKSNIALAYDRSNSEIEALAKRFSEEINAIHPTNMTWQKGIMKGQAFIEFGLIDHIEHPDIENEDQAYRLQINSNFIRLEATTITGLFYATQSLKQLYRYEYLDSNDGFVYLPCMTITDWPNFKLRGWQDDISRGPIVTMDYLKRLILQMAECKINFFSLYTEHTFRTESHPDVAPIEAFTADEIKELEAFCKPYHIQIIGNQQCFAHFEEILKNPFYDDIADAPDNVNPGTEKTYAFLEDLIKEEAESYSHPLFNINCDETESLGSGKAKAYVDSIGSTTAYYKHINRVNQIVKKYGKRAMMWGDIADAHPDILENLDKDIILIAWSYAARDSFDEFLEPYVASGHEFMVAPGCSMSGWVWPYYHDLTSDIPHLCRDGYRKGAFGVMNTSWDDFGESQINTALYGLALGAEMSWNPIKNTDIEKATSEEKERKISENFSTHFFGFPDAQLEHALKTVSTLSETENIGRFASMTEKMTPFYPSQIGDSIEMFYNNLLDNWFNPNNADKNIEKKIESVQKRAKWNADVFDNALYAVHRIKWCAKRNIARCQLYRTYQNPNAANIAESKRQINELIDELHALKCEYIKVWEIESRPYWLDVNLQKYDDVARELQQLEYLPFIESTLNNEGQTAVTLRTIYNDKEIHYTIDGKEVTKDDPIYQEPITITQSCLVKAKCSDATGKAVGSERYFLYHKGMGKFKNLNSVVGNYRPEYSAGGDNALIDGNLGSNDYKDGHWQGFYGTDADLELDFGQKENINSLKIGFNVNAIDWILKPNELEIFTSNNGKDYKPYKTFQIQTEVETKGNFTFRETFETPKLNTRYLRIVVKNPGVIPAGLPGAGYDSWIFMDEIEVE